MQELIKQHLREWEKTGASPFAVELVRTVLDRVAQGMTDSHIIAYLNWRKRNVDKTGENAEIIERIKESFQTEGSRLWKATDEIRDKLQRLEEERKAKKESIPPEESGAWMTPILAYECWKDEQRYKNGLIPPDARGRSRSSGRKRKKDKPQKLPPWLYV